MKISFAELNLKGAIESIKVVERDTIIKRK